MTGTSAADLGARLQKIRVLVLDVDGVMTDGGICIDDRGVEGKRFGVQDGSAVWLLRKAGIETAIISGRYAACVTVRARQLRIQQVHQASRNKVASFQEILVHHEVGADECAYMGDDILDIPLMRVVGVSATPQNGRPEAKAAADIVTEASGGCGAIRELAERILRAQDRYDSLLQEVYGI